jgi:hypothetical protein
VAVPGSVEVTAGLLQRPGLVQCLRLAKPVTEVTVDAQPTPYVWIIGRTLTNGPLDYSVVHKMPAPNGPPGITMRLYSPKASVLNSTWASPAVRRI